MSKDGIYFSGDTLIAATNSGLRCFIVVLWCDWGMIISAAIRVLVVDDFVPLAELHRCASRKILSLVSIVGFASDLIAEAEVQKTAEMQPDLILMDINLPNLSGISAARRIQELSLKNKDSFRQPEP